jgi:hypothetical protein
MQSFLRKSLFLAYNSRSNGSPWLYSNVCIPLLRKVRESMSSNGGTSNHTSNGNHSKTSALKTRDDRVRTGDNRKGA